MTALALQKLAHDREALIKGKPDKYVSAMQGAVYQALTDFCRQDSEFAQAVYQGGSFADCMTTVTKGIKNGSISDLDAYRLAVQFYFPGADIRCQMSVNLCASVEQPEAAADKSLVLDLFDLM